MVGNFNVFVKKNIKFHTQNGEYYVIVVWSMSMWGVKITHTTF